MAQQPLSGDPRITGALAGQGYGPLAPSGYVPDFSEADPSAIPLWTPTPTASDTAMDRLRLALPEAAARYRVSQWQLGTPQPGLFHDIGQGYGGRLGGAIADLLPQAPHTGEEAALMFGMPAVGMVRAIGKGATELTAAQKAASLEETFPHAQAGQFATGRDLKLAMEDRVKQAAGDQAAGLTELTLANQDQHLVPLGVADATYAMRDNANAVGWYDRTVKKALGVLGVIHPEMVTDPAARFAHRVALAVTSNGNLVDTNFRLAEKAYRHWQETGLMPTNIGIGKAAPAINQHMEVFNDLVADHGYEGAERFLNEPITVSQLTKMGYPVTGEKASETVRGAAIFGPKIGNGFYSNLNGRFDALTMDRWLMRTWGRWTGNLIEKRPDMVAQKGNELAGFINKMTPKQRTSFEEITGVKLDANDPVKTGQAIAIASADPGIRAKISSVGSSVGDSIRKTSNMLNKYVDGQIEQPSQAQRPYIRQTFGKILQGMHAKGHGALTMSDLQALLWYPEKRLYDTAKLKSGNVLAGYEEGATPDYATAAIRLAKEMGASDDQINAALARIHSDGRPAAAR